MKKPKKMKIRHLQKNSCTSNTRKKNYFLMVRPLVCYLAVNCYNHKISSGWNKLRTRFSKSLYASYRCPIKLLLHYCVIRYSLLQVHPPQEFPEKWVDIVQLGKSMADYRGKTWSNLPLTWPRKDFVLVMLLMLLQKGRRWIGSKRILGWGTIWFIKLFSNQVRLLLVTLVPNILVLRYFYEVLGSF